MAEQRTWQAIVAADPTHSARYARRWDDMQAHGKDIYGEARLADAMVPRSARILDAGCGQGRVGGYLIDQGHQVTGVDIDPYLIDVARARHPEGAWHVADLADLPEVLADVAGFTLIICAGNVLTFVDPADRKKVLAGFAALLADDGRAVIGFGTSRGYEVDDFFTDCASAGLQVVQQYRSWELHPVDDHSDFLVAVVARG
ncbi:class I SAM-dependent methyltransferase [Corynebacterium sp. TAE3-ERU12]|uniref:class I SAM-dependent DNA methyltransferase n=1 Tax=Corynebacterium sp. TAE3-ERU12 TaxID=2849491 RepID=UPI001C47E1AF|nr:class I SAM-dependent methyltransferase [Corynebacterium sp. TAE3-ERU12]MBV7294613.1 class I SAM-dependent methyltransferase [Corynebacterium sp. TAE3-ERU12]